MSSIVMLRTFQSLARRLCSIRTGAKKNVLCNGLLLFLLLVTIGGCKDFNDPRTLCASNVHISLKKFAPQHLYLIPSLVENELVIMQGQGMALLLTNSHKLYFWVGNQLLKNSNNQPITYLIKDRQGIPTTKLDIVPYEGKGAVQKLFKSMATKSGLFPMQEKHFSPEIKIKKYNKSGQVIQTNTPYSLDPNANDIYVVFEEGMHQHILYMTYAKTTSLISPQCGMQQSYILEKVIFKHPSTVAKENKKGIFIGMPVIKNRVILKKNKEQEEGNSNQDVNVELYY